MANDEKKVADIKMQAKELCVRVKNESDNIWLKKQALHLEGYCAISLGNPAEVLALMNETNEPLLPTDELLATAYQMSGDIAKSKNVLQVNVFKHVIALFKTLPVYLLYSTDDIKKFEEIYDCAIIAANAFNVREIYPYLLISLYMSAAQGFTANGNIEKALDNLQQYTELVTCGMYSIKPKSNTFFDLVDDWINLPDLTVEFTLDDKVMKQALADAVTENPAFAVLSENPRFKNIVEKLKAFTKKEVKK